MRHHAILALLTALGAGPMTAPEPLTALSLGLGLLGLAVAGTRRHT